MRADEWPHPLAPVFMMSDSPDTETLKTDDAGHGDVV